MNIKLNLRRFNFSLFKKIDTFFIFLFISKVLSFNIIIYIKNFFYQLIDEVRTDIIKNLIKKLYTNLTIKVFINYNNILKIFTR